MLWDPLQGDVIFKYAIHESFNCEYISFHLLAKVFNLKTWACGHVPLISHIMVQMVGFILTNDYQITKTILPALATSYMYT